MRSSDEKIQRLLFSPDDDEARDGLLHLYRGYGLKMYRYLRLRVPHEKPEICADVVYSSFIELFQAIIDGKLQKSTRGLPIHQLFSRGLRKLWVNQADTNAVTVEDFLSGMHRHPAKRREAEELMALKTLPEFRNHFDEWLGDHTEEVDCATEAGESDGVSENESEEEDEANPVEKESRDYLMWLVVLPFLGLALVATFAMMQRNSTASQEPQIGQTEEIGPFKGEAPLPQKEVAPLRSSGDPVILKLNDQLYQFRGMLIAASSAEEATNKATRYLEPTELESDLRLEIQNYQESP